MRITFILPPVSMSGGIRVVATYARIFRERGHRVSLVYPPPADMPIWRKIRSLLFGNGWPKYHRSPESHLDGLGLDCRILDRSRAVSEQDVPDADVVIATWWETAEWVNALSVSKGAKVYFVQGHEVFDNLPQDRTRATYYLPLQKIVVSKWLFDIMLSEYGDRDSVIVPNSVDRKQFFSPVRSKQANPTVGFLYSSSDLKGVDVTVKAIKLLRHQIPHLRIISFGSIAPEPDSFASLLVDFHLLPPQDEIRKMYSRCDVWITASRSEGFNLPAMEAMVCRTPVVSTKTGWPEEAILSGVNGYLVGIDDVDSLAKAVANILDLQDNEWEIMSKNAFDTVSKSSWESSANLFERALRSACARS